MVELKAYPNTGMTDFKVSSSMVLHNSILLVRYSVEGDLSQIKNLKKAHGPQERKNELWTTTCFEWFLKPNGESSYWECNLNSSGDWELFSLSDYRKDLRQEDLISTLNVESSYETPDKWNMVSSVNLKPLNLEKFKNGFSASLTVILEDKKGTKSYWAPTHLQPKPDFHHPDHFTIKLP